ncbi:hypothetical protein FRC07_014150, partial [Ceratobasidium sp. 392]
LASLVRRTWWGSHWGNRRLCRLPHVIRLGLGLPIQPHPTPSSKVRLVAIQQPTKAYRIHERLG